MDNITPLVSQLRQRITTTARNIDGVVIQPSPPTSVEAVPSTIADIARKLTYTNSNTEDAHVSSGATNPNAILHNLSYGH